MKLLYKNRKLTAAVLSLVIAGSTSAFAVPTLMLSSDGGSSWTTTIGSADGALSYVGFVGSWSVSVNGSTILSPAEMDLLDVTARTRSAGSLTLRFFETDLTVDSVSGFFKNQAAGIVANYGSLSLNTYIDPANNGFLTIPGTSVLLTGQTLFGAFDETVNSSYAPLPSQPFSLMVEATIRLRGAGGTTTFSQSLVDPLPQVPDGGSTMALLGAVLVGFGWFSRSRKMSV